MARERLSLKARALMWLAQREHSRTELRRKLLAAARKEQKEREAQRALAGEAPDAAGCADPERCVDQLLAWLEANRYLSEARFVESRINARAARYGNLRIRQELAQHGVTADAATQQQLRESELQRAQDVWRRKFGEPAGDPKERARQMRFLVQRGFSPEVVRRVVRDTDDIA
ncbi:regulatory protein RecX [Ideonella sp. BN130291]|uniref:regulatory protein RecX n=1 Tax=Ideonella sp. BN130291 TaxID=3112940 RepID=UPI002E2532CA|nr:regulatory protein RecX [Ideonella sp. BN130291]